MDAEWISTQEAAAILGIKQQPTNRLAQLGAIVARKAERPHPNGHYPWECYRPSVEARAARMKQTPEEPDYLKEWMPIAEAMKALKLTRHAVKRRMHMGLLNSTHFGPPEKQALYVSRAQVEEQVKQRPAYARKTEWHIAAEERDLVWFAGFFDGEGCICISRRQRGWNTGHFLTLSLPNSSRAAMDRIERSKIGGQIYVRPRQKPHYRDQWVWHAAGDEALGILRIIQSELTAKAPQAEIAIEFQERIHQRRFSQWEVVPPEEIEWREQQRQKISALNRPNVDQ